MLSRLREPQHWEMRLINNIHRLWSQLELLKTLGQQTAGVKWARESIQDATHEIERLAPDDVAAEFARNIRLELAQLSDAHEARFGDTGVGEAIDALSRYVEIIGASADHFQKPMREL
jgi:hypothetical protein